MENNIIKNTDVDLNNADVIIYSVTDSALEQLKAIYSELPDIKNKEGYEFIRKGIAEIRTLRTDVEKTRETYKRKIKSVGEKIDAEAKRITAELKSVELPLKAIKDDYDAEVEAEKKAKKEAEETRINKIRARIDNIKNLPLQLVGETPAAITQSLEMLVNSPVDDSFQELKQIAAIEKAVIISKLSELLKQAEKLEADRVAIEKEQSAARAEQAIIDEKNKVDKEQREAEKIIQDEANAAERLKLKEKRAEIDRQQAEIDREKAEIEKEKARIKKIEDDKIEKEQLYVIDAERNKAERAEKEQIENESTIVRSAINEANSEIMKHEIYKLADLIYKGKIPNVIFKIGANKK